MLTGKQKRYLRALGSTMDPVVQIGKAGVEGPVIVSTREAIQAREFIKVRVLPNCMEEPKVAINELGKATGAEIVQVIGRNGLLFKQNEKDSKIELPM